MGRAAAAIVLACFCSGPFFCAAGSYSARGFGATRLQSDDEQVIRDARARSNKAIAAHDLEAIAGVWMEDVHIVSSTSVQTAGRILNRQRMARQFANRPDTVYVRRPTAIDVYPSWAVASERGEWTGRWTEPDGVLEIGGTYQAQWRKLDGKWLIQAELYVPTHCTGARYCRQRP
jgi:ketosteroid isomerase-like protein